MSGEALCCDSQYGRVVPVPLVIGGPNDKVGTKLTSLRVDVVGNQDLAASAVLVFTHSRKHGCPVVFGGNEMCYKSATREEVLDHEGLLAGCQDGVG